MVKSFCHVLNIFGMCMTRGGAIMAKKFFARDAETMSREVYATIKVKDITEYYNLKEGLYFRWWEIMATALLFIGGLGFIVTALYLLPPKNPQLYLRFLAFWAILLSFAIMAMLEIIMRKVRILSRMLWFHDRFIQELQKSIKDTAQEKDSSASGQHEKIK